VGVFGDAVVVSNRPNHPKLPFNADLADLPKVRLVKCDWWGGS